MKWQAGYTLIELVIFIVILGILATSILASFEVAMKKSPTIEYVARATELAEQRMDLVWGNRYAVGFNSVTDSCVASPSLPVCSVPTGYAVTTSIALTTTSFKTITVNVSGKATASAVGEVANYDN